jgi:general secretion pathway protein C
VAGLGLFVLLCALATHWVLVFSAMKTIPVPQSARVARTEALETGAAATLFGGTAQAGRDIQLLGVVADVDSGAGAAIVSVDGGPPKAVRVGAALSQKVKLIEIRERAVVIERAGVRQELALPLRQGVSAGAPVNVPAAPPSGAAAPLSTPAQPAPPPAPPAAAPAGNAGTVPGIAEIPHVQPGEVAPDGVMPAKD